MTAAIWIAAYCAPSVIVTGLCILRAHRRGFRFTAPRTPQHARDQRGEGEKVRGGIQSHSEVI